MNSANGPERMIRLARSRVYAHLAACFRYPDEASWEELSGREGRGSFAHACALLAEEEAYRAMRRHCGGLPVKKCRYLDALRELYEGVFGHTISKQCPPYETEYGNMHLFQQSDFLADLAGFYRAFGVESKERGERLDHITTQLEFLHLLTFKEAHAVQHHGEEEACICRDAQVSFLEDHLGRWAPVFARRLERKEPKGFYGAAARLLSDFIGAEVKALPVDPDLVPDVSRGEFLPMAGDEWGSSHWQQTGDRASGVN